MILWRGWRHSGTAAVVCTALEFRMIGGVFRSASWVMKRLWKKGKCVNMYRGHRDHSNSTAWTADMVRFIGLSLFWQPSVRQCLKLGHSQLESVPQNGKYSLGDSASNWGTFSWRHCLKLGHIHLETVPQTEAHSVGNSASNWTYSLGDGASNWATFSGRQCPRVTILGVRNSSWVAVTWSQWLKFGHSYFERGPQPVIVNYQTELLIMSESLWDIAWNWNKMAFTVYPNLDHIAPIQAPCN